MPLGHLIAVNANDYKQLSGLSDTALWDALQELLKDRLETSSAVDTARGHIPLQGYLLEDETWDNVLSGKEMFRLIEGGECVVEVNDANVTKELAQRLTLLTKDKVGALVQSYEAEMAPKRQARMTIPPKQSFFGKLFGKKPVSVPEIQVIDSMEPSLFKVLEDVKALYVKATENGDSMITTVMV